MALDEPTETDLVTNTEGFNFVIDKSLSQQYRNFSIVYQDGILFKGLRIYAQGAPHC